MRLIKIVDLCEKLGIPRRTVNSWVEKDRTIAIWLPFKGKRGAPKTKGNGQYWIRLDRLEGRPGIDFIDALTLENARWIKAVELSRISGWSRRTIAHWCAHRPRFGKRIGRLWYVDIEQFGATAEQIEQLGNSSKHFTHFQ